MIGIRQFAYDWIGLYTEIGEVTLESLQRAKDKGDHHDLRLAERRLTRLLWQFRPSIVRAYRRAEARSVPRAGRRVSRPAA